MKSLRRQNKIKTNFVIKVVNLNLLLFADDEIFICLAECCF